MNRITITIIAAILTYSAAAAQDLNRHEFSANIGGGISGFQFRPTIGKDFWEGTSTFGLGYHYLLDPNWSIGTGANFTAYKGSISIKNYDQQQGAINTITGHTFDFFITSSAYEETQQAMMITIPLTAQYQYQFDEKMAFYVVFGFKAGIPVSGKSQSKSAFTTKGYYPNLNVTYEDLPDYGFVTNQPFPEGKTDFGLKTAIMMSTELGVKWPLGETKSLYAGIYADYGLNNILKKTTAANTNLVCYQSDSPAQFAYNTAVNSYAKKMKPFAIGITLRFAFQLKTQYAND